MEVAKSKAELRECLEALRSKRRSIGLIPTMGALHEGHLSLVKTAKAHCDLTIVSIFVNPTQFGPDEDFNRYPRDPDRDCRLLDQSTVDVAYLPSTGEMYGADESITIDPGPVGETFEGAMRPGHFRGVLTVVAKLFNQVQPQVAVFGAKDIQQLFLVRRMVRELCFPLEIIESPTRREPDGLAMSSRNVYLKSSERQKATVLWRALQKGVSILDDGDRSLVRLQTTMRTVLNSEPDFITDYATAVSEESFAEMDPVADSSRLIVAGRLGSVRLIDNLRWVNT